MMNIDQLRMELEYDEGCKYEIYLDHLDLPTFGIGHLVTVDDPEYDQPVGTPVDEARVVEVFEQDVQVTIGECKKLYEDWDDFPEEVQLICANMMFNMGRPRLSAFKGMKRGLDARDWNAAADEMVDSKWYQQVTNRAQRLVDRMRNVA
jgi:lysozyme